MENGHKTSEITEITEITEVTEIGEQEHSVTEGEDSNSDRPEVKGVKEGLYDKIPLSKKQLEIIIIILAVGLIVSFILGALLGNGII